MHWETGSSTKWSFCDLYWALGESIARETQKKRLKYYQCNWRLPKELVTLNSLYGINIKRIRRRHWTNHWNEHTLKERRSKSITSRLLRKMQLSLILCSSWRNSHKKAPYVLDIYKMFPPVLFAAVHFTTVLASQCRITGLWNRFRMICEFQGIWNEQLMPSWICLDSFLQHVSFFKIILAVILDEGGK
jgi:hypothetical protein